MHVGVYRLPLWHPVLVARQVAPIVEHAPGRLPQLATIEPTRGGAGRPGVTSRPHAARGRRGVVPAVRSSASAIRSFQTERAPPSTRSSFTRL